MTATSDGQLRGLSILLQISRRVREAARQEEIGFIAVNESKQLLHYRQAALWLEGYGVFAVSGIPEPDPSVPYIQWLNAAFREWRKDTTCRRINAADLPSLLSQNWFEWLPEHAVVVPLISKTGRAFAYFLVARDEEWQEQELTLLAELASIYAHGLQTIRPVKSLQKGVGIFLTKTGGKVALVALFIIALFTPVRMSVQAPAEVVPKDPFVVRSPMEGVIDRFFVRPNEPVAAGQLLFAFDRTNLRARVGVANKAFEVASEEYRQAAQMALADEKSRAEITPRRGRMEEKSMELSYSQRLLQRLEVRSPRPGIAVFTEQSDWIGKNVSVGERVLLIADPARTEILIHLPVADAMDLTLGTPVRFYLDTAPQHAVAGTLRYAAYKPEVIPAGFVAYRLKAEFAPGVKPPRIGLTGTARIYGRKVALGYYLFRRPLTALRQRFGW